MLLKMGHLCLLQHPIICSTLNRFFFISNSPFSSQVLPKD